MTEMVLSLYRGLIPKRAPTMREIAELVAERRGLTLEELRGSSRVHKVCHPRQEAMALIMAQGRFSYPQVGRFFDRDHSTVIHAVQAYAERVEKAKRAA
jgi:chromosomal replication initiator protein